MWGGCAELNFPNSARPGTRKGLSTVFMPWKLNFEQEDSQLVNLLPDMI